MTDHPAHQLASQAADAAEGLHEFLSPVRDFVYPGASFPRDLTDSERAALLPQLLQTLDYLGGCAEAIAGAPEYEGTPRQHLYAAARLASQAGNEVQAAHKALGPRTGQPGTRAQPQLAARDFPQAAAPHPAAGIPTAHPPAPGTPAPAPPRRSNTSRPRNRRTP
jgi:hypothetical protein